ncbi:MAG: hypothetical protein H0X39_13510 [Actinobacteria bacterium]|nr:hypothetical protein [Actinomycetota bacterium]
MPNELAAAAVTGAAGLLGAAIGASTAYASNRQSLKNLNKFRWEETRRRTYSEFLALLGATRREVLQLSETTWPKEQPETERIRPRLVALRTRLSASVNEAYLVAPRDLYELIRELNVNVVELLPPHLSLETGPTDPAAYAETREKWSRTLNQFLLKAGLSDIAQAT